MYTCALQDSAKDLLSDINNTNSTEVELLLQIDIMSKNCSLYPCTCSNNLRPCKSPANGSGPFTFNLLKPTGYVMHQQFNIQQLYVLPTLHLCVLYLSENKQRLVPLTA